MSRDLTHADDSAYRRFERAIEWPMLVLSVIFVALLIVPSIVTVEEAATELALAIIWVLFGLEVVILFVLAPSKRQMFQEHWLDVLIVAAPFLRPLRVARLIRVVRAGSAIGRVLAGVTAVAQRRGLQMYGAFTIIVIAGSAMLVYGLERDVSESNITNGGDALWWATVTATTVGYGDHFPVTTEGRAVAVLLMLVGIGLLGVVTANVAAFFVEGDQADDMADLRAQLDRIEAMLANRS